jgi:arylsulfatase A-like enzyme
MRSRRSLALLVFAGLALAALVAQWATSGPPANVLLISVDTLRHDRLGYAGYGRGTSPRIDELARDGVVFERSYSQSGWTLPSMATVHTGLYPHQHGATRFDRAMRTDVPTLATMLLSLGYDTRAYVSHILVSERYEFDHGFERFDTSAFDPANPGGIATGERLTDLVLGDIGEIQEPYFLWIHYFDPHSPYLPHADFDFGDARTDRYDGEIAYTDRHVGRLLDALGERGLLENTAVVFTSDHGEEFGEHGGDRHFSLHEEVLRTPLVIRAPGVPPRTVTEPVEQIDLLPTLLSLLGLDVDPDYPGRDILATPVPPHTIYAERTAPATLRQRAVIDRDHKLIVVEDNPHPPSYAESFTYDQLSRVEPGLHLYDLDADPAEATNLYTPHGEERLRLRGLYDGHFQTPVERRSTVDVDADLQEQLRILGYIDPEPTPPLSPPSAGN